MPGSILGNRVRRVEDPDLLTGRGTYVGNLRVPGLLRAVFVRSPFAHARIESIDTSDAAGMPGVVGVFTADDLGVAPFHGFMVLNEACARPALATGKVCFVGDPVAVVVAETEAQALDAAETVIVEYDPLEAAADLRHAVADDAPLQFEKIGSNVVAGMAGAGDPLEGAHRVVRAQLENQRVAVVPMEGDAIAAIPSDCGAGAEYDDYRMTVYVSTQMPHGFATAIGRVLGYATEDVRVIAPHVGGGFGAKAGIGAEHASVIAAARHLGRPVTWVQTRSDNLVAMPHGRGQLQWIEMGFDEDHRITGMRCRILGDAGAYAGFGGALAIGPTRSMAQGVYAIPRIRYDVAVAVTNTTPMGAFRGAGRPEAAEFLERMMDIAAAELDIDPVQIRRLNLLPPFDGEYRTVMGTPYDNGDYLNTLEQALAHAGYEELRAEQAARRARGDRVQMGIGMGVYVEITGGGAGEEFAAVEVHGDGTATIRVGTSAHGQGHATSFAMIVSDQLGIPIEDIRFVQSDTAAVPRGGGTGGSRSLQIGGSAVLTATESVLQQAKEIAAAELEASPDDIVVHDGGLGVAGVPSRTLGWGELADRSGAGLAAQVDFKVQGATFPFGAHVSVVEVDTETGHVRPLRHVAVDDCGRILNPLLVTGQQHGGIAQGMAQALWEGVVYDEEGNPLTSNLADYAMPSAAEFPSFETFNTETPTYRNPLGAKGIGESGTIGSTPSVHNAVIDAVSHLGVRHIPMPCTPERVWRAVAAARGGGSQVPWNEPPAAFDRLPGPDQAERPEAADVDI
ncbi:MAG TPA: xanthine dehydrogenase family protein molybdopterin-binding subunit [Acidimicrobiales bacterium]|jgi:carbon-monoxide dehydrogenase large subunit|nr:xanthine dehydrogenase family protein molybdopterin-binding subunit [Acidimicrobiales bacterium]